jgi:AraC-like DNA-binding protein
VLVAASDRQFGPSRLRSILILERRFRIHVVMRDRLVYDTKFAARGLGGSISTLYYVASGNVQIGGGEILGPGRAYMLAASEFEAVEAGAQHVRSWGEPSIVVDLKLRNEDVKVPIGLAHGPVVLGEKSRAAMHAMAEGLRAGVAVEGHTPALLAALVEDGVIPQDIAGSIEPSEPEPLARLWQGLTPLIQNQVTSASIFEIKKITGMSIRQLARDIKLLTKTFGLPGEGFRDTAKVMRLRTAVVLLSAPGATATEVARQVGYKSLEAMGRAFRDEGLPAPSVVHDQVRYEAMAGLPAGS